MPGGLCSVAANSINSDYVFPLCDSMHEASAFASFVSSTTVNTCSPGRLCILSSSSCSLGPTACCGSFGGFSSESFPRTWSREGSRNIELQKQTTVLYYYGVISNWRYLGERELIWQNHSFLGKESFFILCENQLLVGVLGRLCGLQYQSDMKVTNPINVSMCLNGAYWVQLLSSLNFTFVLFCLVYFT